MQTKMVHLLLFLSSDNQTYVKSFPKDEDGYYSYDLDSLSGVVLDVMNMTGHYLAWNSYLAH